MTSCPPGKKLVGNKCVNIGGTHIPKCPRGTRLVGNRCIGNIKPIRCSRGSVLMGNRCVRIKGGHPGGVHHSGGGHHFGGGHRRRL